MKDFSVDARHKPIIKTNKISNFFFSCASLSSAIHPREFVNRFPQVATDQLELHK